MTGFLEDAFLREKGLSDDDIALINAELPDIDNLIAVFQSHQAQINRALRLLTVVRKIIASERQS